MGFERELAELQRAIERVNHEYSAFLYGTAARAPVESRRQVEAMVRRLNSVEMEAAEERYRFATLQAHFNALAERWQRQQAEKEEGKRPGFYATFSGAAERPRHDPNAERPGSVHTTGRPEAEPDRELFERYRGAKKAMGEDVSGFDYRQFAENLERERQKIREKTGTEDFEFDVKDSDGRVRLVARRRKPAEER
jgi:vacuolar-type H+-ATPase subunit I/STV1